MRVERGDVVMVDFPFGEGRGSKLRPAVVVQCDTDNRRLGTIIVAMITKQTALAGREPRHILIDVATDAGKASGLWLQSVVELLAGGDNQSRSRRPPARLLVRSVNGATLGQSSRGIGPINAVVA